MIPKGLMDKSPRVNEAVSRFLKNELSKANPAPMLMPAKIAPQGISELAVGEQASASVGRMALDKVGIDVKTRSRR